MTLRGLIILVNYNQEAEIGEVLEKLPTYYNREDVIVVDDGSTDNSASIAVSKGYKLFQHSKNMGIGAAIRTGYKYAIDHKYDFVTIMSSNGKIRPEDLQTIISPIQNGEADYVTGSRFMRTGGSPGLGLFRRLAIPAFSLLSICILGRHFSDITCGFRAYTVSFLKDNRMNWEQEWLNRYELEYYVHFWACKLGYKIKQVPVTIPYTHLSKTRKSKIVPIIDWWRIIRPFLLLTLKFKK